MKNYGSFILVGYSNNAAFLQEAFTLILTKALLEIVVLRPRWVNEMPSGQEYIRHQVKITRLKDILSIISVEADVEFTLNIALYTGTFHTGLNAYSSGSSGALNSQCVKDFVLYYLSNVEVNE